MASRLNARSIRRMVKNVNHIKGNHMEIDAYVRVLAEAVNVPESLVRLAMKDNPPGYQEFLERLSELAVVSNELNDTNFTEQSFLANMRPEDIPPTMRTKARDK